MTKYERISGEKGTFKTKKIEMNVIGIKKENNKYSTRGKKGGRDHFSLRK